MKWEKATEPPPPKCGAPGAPGSRTLCELPPDHVVGRATCDPLHWPDHFGRGPAGRWYSWPPQTPGETP